MLRPPCATRSVADNLEMLTRRNSLRLPGYDYSLPGPYFLTVCCVERKHLLGRIEEGVYIPSALGNLVGEMWEEQANRFPGLVLDAWTRMSNHLHMIVGFTTIGQTGNLEVPRIMQGFKANTTIQARKRGLLELPHLFQSGYYDHIVRGDKSLERIREYIFTNPQRWHLDKENEDRTGIDEFETWLEEEDRGAPCGAR